VPKLREVGTAREGGREKSATALERPKAAATPLSDRLAARDRAHGLLDGLTRLGAGWDCAEAWWGLARAYEEGGMPEKAEKALWWCVELEEGRGVRGWGVVGSGRGYVL